MSAPSRSLAFPDFGPFMQAAQALGLKTSPAHMSLYCALGARSQAVVMAIDDDVFKLLAAQRRATQVKGHLASMRTKRTRFTVLEGGGR